MYDRQSRLKSLKMAMSRLGGESVGSYRTMTGKGLPMTLRGTDVKGTKLKVPEVEHAGRFCDDSPAKKMKVPCLKSPPVDGTDGFETACSGAVRDINLLFTKYSEVLRWCDVCFQSLLVFIRIHASLDQ
ncbi:uncharacterized protein LOC132901436 isoform X2 [Neoarius graeffei]|uniref:uncharacterized protein LOC132901436 isoform X2 n=1 Tax=Neoarius graeffei TaxID=443677 RepID=UPI00298C761F|nr:uncharacterized protein LOC132901436 isoform X2 [Neoarius graeffei]